MDCKNCKKYIKQIKDLRSKYRMLAWERDEYERSAHDWMDNYDKLKEKYEPEIIQESKTKTLEPSRDESINIELGCRRYSGLR